MFYLYYNLGSIAGANVSAVLLQMKQLVAAAIALKGLGSVLFILGSTFGAFLLVCCEFHFVLPDLVLVWTNS